MIYTPRHFIENRPDIIQGLIERYNFATLLTYRDGSPVVSHLPFLLDKTRGEHGTLLAHMARANPQWKTFSSEAEALVIFQGPHAYISPQWYAPKPDNVPTWNYAVVHAYGTPRVIDPEGEAYPVMQRLVRHHDQNWNLELSEQDRREMLREIVVFEIELKKIEAKFKLNQNRSEKDVENVARGLSQSSDQTAREVGVMMGAPRVSGIKKSHFIFYVQDQARSTDFYAKVFDSNPVLQVPGMTEFQLPNGTILGLMPEDNIHRLLQDTIGHPAEARKAPRAEMYFRVDDPQRYHRKAIEYGARELSPLLKRSWGESVAYCADLDGHVLAFAGG